MVKKGKKRKIHIPVESQIRGIKKALKNSKTPPQFKKALKKRLEKLEKK